MNHNDTPITPAIIAVTLIAASLILVGFIYGYFTVASIGALLAAATPLVVEDRLSPMYGIRMEHDKYKVLVSNPAGFEFEQLETYKWGGAEWPTREEAQRVATHLCDFHGQYCEVFDFHEAIAQEKIEKED